MSKNAFEIRETVLAMAKDYMDQQWTMNVDFTRQLFEAGKKSAEDVQAALTPYSMSALLDKADEMYKFINKKGE